MNMETSMFIFTFMMLFGLSLGSIQTPKTDKLEEGLNMGLRRNFVSDTKKSSLSFIGEKEIAKKRNKFVQSDERQSENPTQTKDQELKAKLDNWSTGHSWDNSDSYHNLGLDLPNINSFDEDRQRNPSDFICRNLDSYIETILSSKDGIDLPQKEHDFWPNRHPRFGSDVDNWLRNISCKTCERLVWILRKLADCTTTYDKMVDFSISMCIKYGVNDEKICTMLINAYKEEIQFVVVNLFKSSDEVCQEFLGKNCTKKPDKPMWKVDLPDTPKPAPQPPKPPKASSPKMRFVQITDIHLDPNYAQGSPSVCNEPLCCRDGVNATQPIKAGEFGSYERCDIPRDVVVSLFEHLATQQDKFDYVIFTGDIPAHDIWNQSKSDQVANIRSLEAMFQKYLPFKPVYHAVGNHESSPCDSYPPPSLNVDNMAWLYDTLADIWGRWLSPETDDMIRRCGSYSFSPAPGFRIISLNNIYSSKINFWLIVDDVDPCGVLEFFVKELQKAEDAGEKVHVLTHIPPGIDYMRKAWSFNYYRIVNRYENTIVNQFYGHTHTDFYQVFYDDVTFKRPLGVGFVAPSLTTRTSVSPTYRIYTMDGAYNGSSYAVLDYVTYYLNITKADEEHVIQWEFEYSPKTLYNMPSLYPADWHDLINRMDKDDGLFQKLYRNYYSMHPPGPCDKACKQELLCLLREARSHDPSLCTHRKHLMENDEDDDDIDTL